MHPIQALRPRAQPRLLHQIRAYSAAKTPSAHRGFYKQFGRPIAKVFLMSMAVYQTAYYMWLKLEKDEEARDQSAEIEGLENRLKQVTNYKP